MAERFILMANLAIWMLFALNAENKNITLLGHNIFAMHFATNNIRISVFRAEI